MAPKGSNAVLFDPGAVHIGRSPLVEVKEIGITYGWSTTSESPAAFLLLMHCVVLYEEPTLRQAFGEDYEAYCQQVHRWWPKARHLAAGAAQHR